MVNLANITTNDNMSTYQRFLHYFENTEKKIKDITQDFNNDEYNKITGDSKLLKTKIETLIPKINRGFIETSKNAKLEDLKEKLKALTPNAGTIKTNVENGKFEDAKVLVESEDKLIIFNEFIDLHNKIAHWGIDETIEFPDSTKEPFLKALKIINNDKTPLPAQDNSKQAIDKIKRLIDVAVYYENNKEVDDGFLIKGMIDTKIGLAYKWLFDSAARREYVESGKNLDKAFILNPDNGEYYDVNGNPLELFHNEYYENYIKNILTNDYTKSLEKSEKYKELKDITIDEDFLYNYKALKGYIPDGKISRIDKIIRKYTRLQRYKNSSCLTRPLFTPDKNNLRNVHNIIALLIFTFGVEFITSFFVLIFDATTINDDTNDKGERYKKISKDYKIFAPKNNTFLNINFILYNVVYLLCYL